MIQTRHKGLVGQGVPPSVGHLSHWARPLSAQIWAITPINDQTLSLLCTLIMVTQCTLMRVLGRAMLHDECLMDT